MKSEEFGKGKNNGPVSQDSRYGDLREYQYSNRGEEMWNEINEKDNCCARRQAERMNN